jgi:hypothetical protein
MRRLLRGESAAMISMRRTQALPKNYSLDYMGLNTPQWFLLQSSYILYHGMMQ